MRNMNVLRKQKQAVGTGIQQPVLYDLCQTVYPSPQICIPAGDVDACLSMECCVSVFFRLLSKTHFSMVLFSHFGAGGERHGFIRRVLFEPLRVMHNDFSFFGTMNR